jgi:hypothetical protein
MIEWDSFPAKEEPRRALGVAFFIIVLSFLVGILWHPLFGVLSILFLGLSLLPYYTTTHYCMDEKGIMVKKAFYTIKREWRDIHSFYPDRNGVLLSPFSQPTRLENFRGIYIRFNSNRNRDAVLKYLQGRITSASSHNGG